ncbi:KAP family NTPase [Flavobacterium sp. N1946]|uniref:KAP family NTPase n=1 Tax=Flavobacterium sp. N1946 TaxID=2986826 RepID=UPI0022240FAD|nr:KAP family NTPase [Flavobacterium sp. N1946]
MINRIRIIFVFFYFDAWAHEGDPLRRIFLESLINSFKENGNDEDIIKELEEKRKIISREKRVKTTDITRSTTKLGLLLTVAMFFFTIGVALLSAVSYDNVTLKLGGSVNSALLVGIIFSLSPFAVLLYNYNLLRKDKSKLKDLNNWAFLQNNSKETITEDVVGDDERSSIEFEKYFKEILEIYNAQKKRKIVIVLDNLDRVDADVSLRIWSTLQTFIQHKNPASKDYDTFKNVFTIIPYDEQSLKKIWENYTENQDGSRSIDNKFSSSFFDKSFQVRIDVPKPIISNWLDFIQKMVDKSFSEWNKTDKDVVIEVIEKTRKDILDNPKPREIKTYINQVGFLRNHISEQISTKSIAFYVYKRYLQGNSNDEIASYLIDRSKISNEEVNLIDENTILELAAIIYGVSKEQGSQILLTPKILEALNNNNPELLKDLISNFNTVFWSIFKNKITNTDKLRDYLRYCTPINKCFENYDVNINNNFIPSLCQYLSKEKEHNYLFNKNFVQDIKSTSDLFKKFSKDVSIEHVWSFFISVYEYQENKNEASETLNDQRNKFFIETLNHISQTTLINFKVKVLNIKFENWRDLSEYSDFSNISNFLLPSQQNIAETANQINPGHSIPHNVYSLINNYIQHESLNLDPILLNLKNHFSWNYGNQSGNVFNFQSIELFENIFYNYKNHDFSEFLKLPQFYSVCCSTLPENEKDISIIATLCAVYFKEKVIHLTDEISQENYQANNMINNIHDYWKNSDGENAKRSYEILKKNNLLKIVWELSSDANNILCCDIIDLMVSNDDGDAFNIENPFNVLIRVQDIEKKGFNISNLITKFFEYSKLEDDVLMIEDLNLSSNDYVIYKIITSNKSDRILRKIESELKKLDVEVLKESLSVNDYLFDILLKVKEYNNQFFLDKLNDALYGFVCGSFFKNSPMHSLKDWQIENWSKIIKLLEATHYDNFCKRITKLIVDEKENLEGSFFELNNEFINKQFLIELINKEKDIFTLYIQEALQEPSNIDKLIFIEKLFTLDNEKKIKFDKGFKELIRDYVFRINTEDNSEELIRISSIIAKRFSINLEKVKE